MKALLIALYWIPVLAVAAPTVMVDAIPTGAVFFNIATVRLPYSDLDKVNSKEVEAGIASAISNAMLFAQPNDVRYISLLSAAGDNARTFTIDADHAKLKLQSVNPSFVIVLYRGGRDTADHVTYCLGSANSHRKHATMTFRKVSVPPGWTTAAWVYFNLSRIQDEASKAGATQVFLGFGGKGVTSPVVIPGVREPLMVFEDEPTISATWYIQDGSGVEASTK